VRPWLTVQAGEQQQATPLGFALAWSLTPRKNLGPA
jgi:hypothetical protein